MDRLSGLTDTQLQEHFSTYDNKQLIDHLYILHKELSVIEHLVKFVPEYKRKKFTDQIILLNTRLDILIEEIDKMKPPVLKRQTAISGAK